MQTKNNVQETGNTKIGKTVSKTLAVVSIRLWQTDLMIGCWMNHSGATNPSMCKR
jgi:hypothetical protein